MKFMIVFTLPSGTRMAATSAQGKFALSPVSKNRAKGMFLVWDTPGEASQFLEDLIKNNPQFKGDIKALNPKVTAIRPDPQIAD